MTIHWLKTPEAFAAQAEAWDAFVGTFEGDQITPFHSAAWVHACMASPMNDVFVAVVKDADGQLCAGLVFNVEKDNGGAVLYPIRLLGMTPHISNAYPASMIYLIREDCAEDIPLVEILEAALDQRHCPAAFFVDVDEQDNALRKAIVEVARRHNWHLREGQSSTDAWLDIAEGREAYMKTRSQKLRRNQKAARRALANMGEQRFFDAVEEGWDWPRIEAALVEAFERSWQVTSDESPLYHTHRQWTLQACETLFHAGMFRAFFYCLDDQPIAFEFGVAGRGIYYALVRGLDKAYGKHSPGNLLAEESIDFLQQRGHHAIFLGAIYLSETTKYKTRWMSREEPNANMMLIRKQSLYGQIDQWYYGKLFFHKLWWKLKIGPLLRRWLA